MRKNYILKVILLTLFITAISTFNSKVYSSNDGLGNSTYKTASGGAIKDRIPDNLFKIFPSPLVLQNIATTDAASSITSTTATLNGTIALAAGYTCTIYFEYGTSISYGSGQLAATPSSLNSYTAGTATSYALTGLTPNTTYYFRVVGVYSTGPTKQPTGGPTGSAMTFTTTALTPTATTVAATSITSSTATLNGTVNANNASSVVSFEYGTTTSYGTTVIATQSPVTGASATSVSRSLTGLTPNTTYHYRVTGVNTAGTTNGSDMTFTTPSAIPNPTSTITFNTNGGNSIAPITQDEGTAVTAPADPTKSGYTFQGWVPAVPATMPVDDITCIAQWLQNSSTITFNSNGGTAVAPITQYEGTPVTAPASPTKAGYTFQGWVPSIPATMPVDDVNCVAQWAINSYQITFDAYGGTGGTILSVDYGTVPTPPVVTRTGYTFSVWTPTVVAVTTDATYTAQWTINSYQITFSANGGTGGTVQSENYGTIPTSPTVTRTGYTFSGWSPTIVAVTTDATYTAQWTINSYQITFSANGGTGGTIQSENYGTIPTPPTVTRTGYTFNGWSPTIITATTDATYTAQWTINSYEITFSANGGSGGTVQSVDYGTVPTPPAVTRTGYTFSNWSPTIIAATTDAIYTAQWTISSYQITFNANGGTGGTVQSVNYGTIPTPPTVTRNCYNFSNWSPTIVAATVDATYNAQWTVNVLSPPTISGTATICNHTTGNVYTTESGMASYNWNVTGGTITAGAGTNAITVTWDTEGAQSVSVNYSNSFGCSPASATIYGVTVKSGPNPVITGSPDNNYIVPKLATYQYSTPLVAGNLYSWSSPKIEGYCSASSRNCINVHFLDPCCVYGQWTISVTETNPSTGCSTKATKLIYITP